MSKFEKSILFDDAAILQDTFGNDGLSPTSLTANCDCTGYMSIQDDEEGSTHTS